MQKINPVPLSDIENARNIRKTRSIIKADIKNTQVFKAMTYQGFQRIVHSRLYFKNGTGTVCLHIRCIQLPGTRRDGPKNSWLQEHKCVCQLIGASGQRIGCPGDMIVIDLGIAEQPPPPPLSKRSARVIYHSAFWIAAAVSNLAGFKTRIQDLRPGRDVV